MARRTRKRSAAAPLGKRRSSPKRRLFVAQSHKISCWETKRDDSSPVCAFSFGKSIAPMILVAAVIPHDQTNELALIRRFHPSMVLDPKTSGIKKRDATVSGSADSSPHWAFGPSYSEWEICLPMIAVLKRSCDDLSTICILGYGAVLAPRIRNPSQEKLT